MLIKRLSIAVMSLALGGVFTTAYADDATPPPVTVTTRSVPVSKPIDVNKPQSELDALDTAFVVGDVKKARELAAAIVKAAHDTSGLDEAIKIALDPAKSRLVVVWPAVDVDDSITLRRLALSQDSADAYTLDTPGIGMLDTTPGFYEVFVAGDKRSSLVSLYTSTRVENPIVAQIVDVAGRVITPLFGLTAGIAGEVRHAAAINRAMTPATQLYVTSSRVVLPWRRASIAVKSQAQVPATPDRVNASVDHVIANLELKELGRSQWARKYADEIGKQAKATAMACATGSIAADKCALQFDKDFIAVFASCVTNAICMPGATPTDDDKSGFAKVDEVVREFVATGFISSVKTDSTFMNRPLTHLGFGLTTGLVLGGTSSRARVKLDDDGELTADPLSRQLSMIVLNWSPAGYNEAAHSPSWSERARLFVGFVITPDFGLGGGGSLLLVRGLAINVGGGVLFSRGLAADDKLGDAPKDAKHPFDLAHTPFVMIGASFNFK